MLAIQQIVKGEEGGRGKLVLRYTLVQKGLAKAEARLFGTFRMLLLLLLRSSRDNLCNFGSPGCLLLQNGNALRSTPMAKRFSSSARALPCLSLSLHGQFFAPHTALYIE